MAYYWPDERKEKMVSMLAAKHTRQEVATELGVTLGAVNGQIHRMQRYGVELDRRTSKASPNVHWTRRRRLR